MSIQKQREKLLVNVDTIEFWISGMDFGNPSSSEVTLLDKTTGVIRDRYGNREFMVGKNGIHRMSVRMMNSGKKLCFSGSPFACVRGQNIFTSADVIKGCAIAIKRAMRVFKIAPPKEVWEKWMEGDINLTRVDLAVNFRMDSEAEVLEVLQQISRQLISRYGTVNKSGTSVCWGPKGGKEYSINFYAKGPQLRRSERYRNHPNRDRLIGEAENILRMEVRLRSAKLGRLKKASAWGIDTAEKKFRQYKAHLKFLSVTSGVVSDEELDELPSRLRPVIALHKSGANLESIYSKRSLQRHRAAFRDRGIDLRCPNQAETAITELRRYLSVKKAINKPPKWMVDAKLVPTDTVAAVGKMKVRSCRSVTTKSKEVASNDFSRADTPLKKTGK